MQHMPPDALTLMIFSSSFKLSPNSFVAVTTNSYTLPLSNSTFSSLTETSVIVFNSVHSPGLASVTILWYTVYWVISFPLFCGSLHFKVTVSSVTSFGRSPIVAATGTPWRKRKISYYGVINLHDRFKIFHIILLQLAVWYSWICW